MPQRDRVAFVCRACGYAAPKWLGRCPTCGEWGTLEEERVGAQGRTSTDSAQPVSLAAAVASSTPRISTGMEEFDRVLGGGFVPGGVVLVGGDPGVGKSTLLLAAVDRVCQSGRKALYVTAEESAEQVALRARRLGATTDTLWLLAETRVDAIAVQVERLAPDFLVVDSVQTVHAPDAPGFSGSVGQVREVGARLVTLAKQTNVATCMVGHVTKEGTLAGPRTLEHLVDAVLYFEGERGATLRILRATKNRYGPATEVGLFEMTSEGLLEVKNPSEALLRERPHGVPGTAVVPIASGARPLLVEVQALVARPQTAMVRRVSPSFDSDRLALLLAVLDQRAGVAVLDRDVFLNVVGGLKLEETSADLGVVLAVASSARNRAIDPATVVLGEVGLGGEVRATAGVEGRLREAARLGFRRAILPKTCKVNGIAIEALGVVDVTGAIEAALG